MGNEEIEKSYDQIKERAVYAYFDFCRDAVLNNKSHLDIIGRLAYEFENEYENPVTAIKVLLVRLILTAGLHPDLAYDLRVTINRLIFDFGIANLIQSVATEESDDFFYDLEVMGFYDSSKNQRD